MIILRRKKHTTNLNRINKIVGYTLTDINTEKGWRNLIDKFTEDYKILYPYNTDNPYNNTKLTIKIIGAVNKDGFEELKKHIENNTTTKILSDSYHYSTQAFEISMQYIIP